MRTYFFYCCNVVAFIMNACKLERNVYRAFNHYVTKELKKTLQKHVFKEKLVSIENRNTSTVCFTRHHEPSGINFQLEGERFSQNNDIVGSESTECLIILLL